MTMTSRFHAPAKVVLLAAVAFVGLPSVRAQASSSTDAVAVRLYQNALNKIVQELPNALGSTLQESNLSFAFASGSSNYLFCTFGYSLGINQVDITVDLTPPQTTMSLAFAPGDVIQGTFNIDAQVSGVPYANIDICGLQPGVSPPVTASGLSGSFSLGLAIQNGQLVVTSTNLQATLGSFNINLGAFTWFLNLIGLDSGFQSWIQGVVQNELNSLVASNLPGALNSLLQNRLDLSATLENFVFSIAPDNLSSSDNGLTLAVDATIEPVTAVPCPTNANCTEPSWPTTYGQPDDADTITNADAAASIGIGPINQALFAAWRSGFFDYSTTVDASTILGAIAPGLPISGTATITITTMAAPTATLPTLASGSSDPSVSFSNVMATIVVEGGSSSSSSPLNITVSTSASATAVLQITPPTINGSPNPNGNVIQFNATNFALGQTTLQYGPSSSLLTASEENQLINQVILPIYQAQVGMLNLAPAILTFNVPGTNDPAALTILRKALTEAGDGIAIYVRFDVAPVGDTTPPQVSISQVSGVAPDKNNKVLIGQNNAVVAYAATDVGSPADTPYITFATSPDNSTWTNRQYFEAVQLTNLPDGTNWFYVRATTFSGVTSNNPAAVQILVDTQPPSTSLVSAPASYINQTSAAVTYQGNDSIAGIKNYQVSIDGGVVTTTTATTSSYTGLVQGPHGIHVAAQNNLNRVDPAGVTAEFIVDLTPPTSSLSAPRSGYVSPKNAIFTATGSDNYTPTNQLAFAFERDGPSCATNGFGNFAENPVADLTGCPMVDGSYTLSVTARDLAGNVQLTPSQIAFIVDGTSPTVQIVSGPSAQSTAQSITFVVTGSDNDTPTAELEYYYRLVGFSPDFSVPTPATTIDLGEVPSGNYTFQAVAVDLAGNQSAVALYPFALDNVAPTTMFTAPLPAYVTTLDYTLAVSGTDDLTPPAQLTYQLTTDYQPVLSGPAPVIMSNIPEGARTVKVAAVDSFGNVDPVGATASFIADRTPPHTSISSRPERIALGTYYPPVSGSDNLTPVDQLRYVYRLQPAQKGAFGAWSEPKLKAEFGIPLSQTGPVTIDIAAMDNAGWMDPNPISLPTTVSSATGCGCHSSPTWGDSLSFLMVGAFLLFRKQARRHMPVLTHR